MITMPTFLYNKIVMIFPMNGDKISFKNDNLLIRDKDNKIKFQYTCYKIFIIFIIGGYTISTGLIERSKKFGFSIIFLNPNFKITATINYKTEGNYLLREKQYKCNSSNKIANRIIYNKLLSEIWYLEKINNPNNNIGLEILKQNLIKLNNYELSINEIMGIEGISAKVYFNRMFSNFDWSGRRPRLKNDIPNLLLDIGYTILFNYIEALLNIYGFDIYKGHLHQEFYKRKSLVCDMIEPFRVIIDYKIRKMYNLGQIKKNNFILGNNRYNINFNISKEIISEFLDEINKYKKCIFDYILKYYRWFMNNQNIDNFPIVRIDKNDTY